MDSSVIHRIGNAEVLSRSAQFSRMLDALGVPVRGAVAALLANTPECLAVYRGATWSGRRYTPMSGRWTADEVAYVTANSEADCLIVDARYADRIGAAAESIAPERRFAIGGELPGFRNWAEVEALSAEAYEAPLAGATMLYTSGTTGRPKGVLRRPPEDAPPPTITGRSGMAMMSAFLPEGARDGVHLVAAPLYHAGPNTYCDGALLLGADVALMERFDAEAFLAAVEETRATSTFLVPTHFVRLLRLPETIRQRYDTSSLELVCHGAAPVSIEVKRAMIEWWGPVLFEFYGATEGGGTMIDSKTWLKKPGSVGQPQPGQDLRILSETGEPIPTGKEGLVCYAVDAAAPFEYKDDPEKTAEGLIGEGYFTLGDVGYLDEEGFLFLCDRRADIIISGGVNLYPAQIESVLMGLPEVADCCVVGVPSEQWGESVCAVVRPEAGETASVSSDTSDTSDTSDASISSEETLRAAILQRCRDQLASHQVPKRVDFVETLPRTETGKLARRLIRDPYWAGRARRV